MSTYATSERARTLANRLLDDFRTHAADLEIEFVRRPTEDPHTGQVDMAEPLRSEAVLDVPISLARSIHGALGRRYSGAELEVKILKGRAHEEPHAMTPQKLSLTELKSPTCPHCWHAHAPAVMFDLWARLWLDNDLPMLWRSERAKAPYGLCLIPRMTFIRRHTTELTCEQCGKMWNCLLVSSPDAPKAEPATTIQRFSLTFPDGSKATGTALTTTVAQWNKERDLAGMFVSNRNMATGAPLDPEDRIVLVDGRGTPLGGSFELPLSTVRSLGFEDAVHASLATILTWRRRFPGGAPKDDGTPWQPLVGCDDPFNWGDRPKASTW